MHTPETIEKKTGFNTPVVIFGVVLAAVFIYVASLFLQGWFLAVQARENIVKTDGPAIEEVAAHRAQQQAILNERARWLDKERGTLCMPIDDAIDRLAAKHAIDTAPNTAPKTNAVP